MKINEFKEFVENNENYKFRSNTLRSIANAVIEIMNKNEELSYKNISKKTGIKYITVYQAINRFKPYEKQIYPQSTSEQIESSLGEAYATGIRGLAKNFNWLGEVITEIGLTAFLGFLMSMHTSPEETEEFLKKFEDPKEVVKSFNDYLTNLMRFSKEASEMQKMKEELEAHKIEVKYLKAENSKLKEAIEERNDVLYLCFEGLGIERSKKILEEYTRLRIHKNTVYYPLVLAEVVNKIRPKEDEHELVKQIIKLRMIGEIIAPSEEITFLRQEIQDLRERVNLEEEIRSLEQKINALTQEAQYIKAKLNAMEKVNSFKQELNKLKEKNAFALN